jgi:hypothetical protein
VDRYSVHILNVSVTTVEPRATVIRDLEGPLMTLASDIRQALDASPS